MPGFLAMTPSQRHKRTAGVNYLCMCMCVHAQCQTPRDSGVICFQRRRILVFSPWRAREWIPQGVLVSIIPACDCWVVHPHVRAVVKPHYSGHYKKAISL